jgi:hypothetical protein
MIIRRQIRGYVAASTSSSNCCWGCNCPEAPDCSGWYCCPDTGTTTYLTTCSEVAASSCTLTGPYLSELAASEECIVPCAGWYCCNQKSEVTYMSNCDEVTAYSCGGPLLGPYVTRLEALTACDLVPTCDNNGGLTDDGCGMRGWYMSGGEWIADNLIYCSCGVAVYPPNTAAEGSHTTTYCCGSVGGYAACCSRNLSHTLTFVDENGFGTITLTWDGATYWSGSITLACGPTLYLRYAASTCSAEYCCDNVSWTPATAIVNTFLSCGPPMISQKWQFPMEASAGCSGFTCPSLVGRFSE